MQMQEMNASTGSPILVKDGIFLASKNNPLREAENWLAKNAEAFSQFETIIILGLGCGYHSHWASLKYPLQKIFVIEPSAEIIKWVRAVGPKQGKNVKIVNLHRKESIFDYPELRDSLNQTYSVIRHQASFQVSRDILSEIETTLLGRTPDSLKFLMKLNPVFGAHATKLERALREAVGFLSIKDIAQVTLTEGLKLGRFTALTRILKELVR